LALGFGQEDVFSRSLPNSVGASRLWDSCLLNSIGSHSHHQIASDRSLTSRIILEAPSCNCHPTCTSFKALEYYLFVQYLIQKPQWLSLNSVYDKPLDMNNTGDWSRSKCPSCRVCCLWSKELCWWYVKSFNGFPLACCVLLTIYCHFLFKHTQFDLLVDDPWTSSKRGQVRISSS
jgi:hypothetical protein